MLPPRAFAAAIIAGAGLLASCGAQRMPTNPSEQALYRDLERHVTFSSATGWTIDSLEVDAILKGGIASICLSDELTRKGTLQFLNGEITRLGGSPKEVWLAKGKDRGAVDDLLRLVRMRAVLERGLELAHECPFWYEPSARFAGRQISDGRWQISVSGGGKGKAIIQGGKVDILAGGSGRLLFGRVFHRGRTLFAGIDAGASAAFPKDEQGERSKLVLAVDFVTPVVFRYPFVNAYWEVEAGPMLRSTERDWSDIDRGVHLGVSFGARGLRTRFVFPGLALGASYERVFSDGGDITMLKVGLRGVFDLDW